MAMLPFLSDYSGESTDELILLEGAYRIDSLVLAIEQAINQKAARAGVQALSSEERLVLAVEELEREVNNGGYQQFFLNMDSADPAHIVDSLNRISCRETAAITAGAIEVLGLSQCSVDAVRAAVGVDSPSVSSALRHCDTRFFAAQEPIAERLFAFVKANKDRIHLR